MNPYVDDAKIYRHGDATVDLWDLTPAQIAGADQIPAVAGEHPDTSHWDDIRLAGERMEADNYEHYRTGRTASHASTIDAGAGDGQAL